LTGKLTKPQGDGPFPAVVLLHGCGGIVKNNDDWAERLTSWGYVALQVDSFGPRGQSNIYSNTMLIPLHLRVQDAYDAKSYLAGFPFVDRNRIAVMGWFTGGNITLAAVSASNYATWAAFFTTKKFLQNHRFTDSTLYLLHRSFIVLHTCKFSPLSISDVIF
jgi:dienelactone hydrolase